MDRPKLEVADVFRRYGEAYRDLGGHLERCDECGHDAPLRGGHRRVVLLPIGFAVAAEPVRHFQLRAIHGPGAQKY